MEAARSQEADVYVKDQFDETGQALESARTEIEAPLCWPSFRIFSFSCAGRHLRFPIVDYSMLLRIYD